MIALCLGMPECADSRQTAGEKVGSGPRHLWPRWMSLTASFFVGALSCQTKFRGYARLNKIEVNRARLTSYLDPIELHVTNQNHKRSGTMPSSNEQMLNRFQDCTSTDLITKLE